MDWQPVIIVVEDQQGDPLCGNRSGQAEEMCHVPNIAQGHPLGMSLYLMQRNRGQLLAIGLCENRIWQFDLFSRWDDRRLRTFVRGLLVGLGTNWFA